MPLSYKKKIKAQYYLSHCRYGVPIVVPVDIRMLEHERRHLYHSTYAVSLSGLNLFWSGKRHGMVHLRDAGSTELSWMFQSVLNDDMESVSYGLMQFLNEHGGNRANLYRFWYDDSPYCLTFEMTVEPSNARDLPHTGWKLCITGTLFPPEDILEYMLVSEITCSEKNSGRRFRMCWGRRSTERRWWIPSWIALSNWSWRYTVLAVPWANRKRRSCFSVVFEPFHLLMTKERPTNSKPTLIRFF